MKDEPEPQPSSNLPPPRPPRGPTTTAAFGDDDDDSKRQPQIETVRIALKPRSTNTDTASTGERIPASSDARPWWKFW